LVFRGFQEVQGVFMSEMKADQIEIYKKAILTSTSKQNPQKFNNSTQNQALNTR
jgi:hypothetical protein